MELALDVILGGGGRRHETVPGDGPVGSEVLSVVRTVVETP